MVKAEEWQKKIDKELETAKKKGQVPGSFIELVSELHIHQTELEMQNEELKQSQEELSQLYSQYHELYDEAPAGYFTLDKDGIIKNVNVNGAELLQLDKSKIIGRGFSQFILKDYESNYFQSLADSVNTGENQKVELQLKRNETLFYAHMEVLPLISDGESYRIVVTDIKEIKKAEESLKMSENRFRAFVKSTSDVVYRMGPDWAEMCQLLGKNFIPNTCSPSETWLDKYIHRDDQQHVQEVINRAIQTKSIFELEHRVLKVDGTLGWTFSRAIPILDENEEIIEWFGTAKDITKRKKAEEQLKQTYDELQREIEDINALYQLSTKVMVVDDLNFILQEVLNTAINLINANMGTIQLMDHLTGTMKIVGSKNFGSHFLKFFESVYPGESAICGIAMARLERVIVEDITRSSIFNDPDSLKVLLNEDVRAVQSTPIVSKDGNLLGIISTHFGEVHVPTERELRFMDILSKTAAEIIQRKYAEDSLKIAHGNLEFKVHERTKELYNERQRLFDVLETLPVQVCLLSPDYYVIFANHAFRNMYGESHGRHCYEYRFGYLEPCEFCESFKPLKTGKPHNWKAVSSEGRVIDAYCFPFIDIDGSKLILEMDIDITEQKQNEEELKRFATVVKDSNDAITVQNFEGNIIAWNYGAENMYGWSEKEALQMNILNTIPKSKRAEMHSFMKKIHAGEITESFETQRQTKDGRLLDVWFTATELTDDAGNPIAIATTERDITGWKQSERKLKKTVEELKRSNEELERFAYISSHDLQEPLRTITSFTQLLERRYKGKFDSDADEFIQYIVEAAVRMKIQIEGLLEYSRISTKGKNFEPVDMNLVLNRTMQNLNASVEESNAEITVDELHNVIGDAVQLQRVFQNLISNAIKFRKCEEPLKIHISSYKDKNEYVFSVNDNGIGIEEQYFGQIFLIFQYLHTRDVYKGTGLGLSIVERIIERHGGRVWVKSEFGAGSTFYFTIPVKPVTNGGNID
jgi:PAS domain S-box-containing protein